MDYDRLKELTRKVMGRNFFFLEEAADSAIQAADRCQLDLMINRLVVAGHSAHLLKNKAYEKYEMGLIALQEFSDILKHTDNVAYTQLPQALIEHLQKSCDCKSK